MNFRGNFFIASSIF